MKKADEGKAEKVDASYFYGFLPKTNCKECGEESCRAFAEKLYNKETTYEDCPPLLRKRIREGKKEQRRLLKELEIEDQIYTEEETYIRANNYGEVVTRIMWPSFSSREDFKPERHIIITTEGLVLMNQLIFPLKKKWETLPTGKTRYPIQKAINYKKRETFSGLIPFKDNSSMPKGSSPWPFFFDAKLIQEESLLDNPWIEAMSGPSGSLLIRFDKTSLQSKEKLDTKKQTEIRIIEVPLDNQSKDAINSFIDLLYYVKYRFAKNQELYDPAILKNIRRKFCKKFQLEESLKRVEKRLSDYELKSASQTTEVTSMPSKFASKEIKTKKASKGKEKNGRKSKKKKTARKLIIWDTSHYEVLRWESEVGELTKVIQKVTGLKVTWLKGSWNSELLSDKKMLKKAAIIVLTGIGSKGKISRKETTAIRNFVEEGGGLFLSAPDFKGEDTNTIATLFGAEFLWNKIRDEEHHEGKHSDHAIISNINSHPICKGVKEVCFGDYGGFPLKIKKEVVPLAQTADSTQPPNAVVLATAKYGKGSIVFFASSTTFKDKYLNMYDNRRLAENIFSYLSTPPVPPDEAPHKEMVREPPVAQVEESTPATLKIEPTVEASPEAEIIEEAPVKKTPVIEEPLKPAVSKPKKAEKVVPPKIPALSTKEIEQQMDKLDEKLVLGEIDEVTYEVERIKLKGDLKDLNQLMSEGRINLKKYIETRNIIHSRSPKKHPSVHCSSCGELLKGIEAFCPNCGEKTK